METPQSRQPRKTVTNSNRKRNKDEDNGYTRSIQLNGK